MRRRGLLLTAGLLLMAQFLLQGVTEPPHHSEQRPLQHSNNEDWIKLSRLVLIGQIS